MALTGARMLIFLAIAGFFWPRPVLLARAEQEAVTAVKPFYRPGEVRTRFDAWEKRARKFEPALTGGFTPERLSGIASRLRLVATDIQAESRALTRQYDALLEAKRRHASESAAKESVLIELGYGPDDLRYAQNVAAYALSLTDRLQQKLDALPPPPSHSPAPIQVPAPAPAPLP